MSDIPSSSRIEIYPCNVKSHLESGSQDSITKLANNLLELFYSGDLIKLSQSNKEKIIPWCEPLDRDIDSLVNEMLDKIEIIKKDEEKIQIPFSKTKKNYKIRASGEKHKNWVRNY